MIPSTIKFYATPQDHHIAKLAALAIGVSLIEVGIPTPIPGVKPGLANIITLVVLHQYGFSSAAWVSILRILAGSLLLGNFLSPAFVMSFSGGICSLFILTLVSRLNNIYFGVVSQSVVASFAHIAAQLLVAYVWLIPHAGISYLIPIFATSALLFGVVNGLIAAYMLDNTVPLKKSKQICE